jgi:drug/metabolite transporter (DMT)-like permease
MLFCLASGAAFGAMAVFGKLAYTEGATVGTLLALRFLFASGLFWLGGAGRRMPPARDVAIGLGLGAGGYALQAGCYFAALERLDASLLALLVYTFPALVAAGAVALGRERLSHRRAASLVVASGGLTLVVAGGLGSLDALGAALGLAAAVVYATYILVSDTLAIPALPLAALVCTGAAVALLLSTALLGQFRPGALSPAGWVWILCLAAVSTVGAIGLFFAGLQRVGPTTASILATVEPLVTVALAFAVFGESLGPLQVAGGILVLAAVLMAPSGRPAAPGCATMAAQT